MGKGTGARKFQKYCWSVVEFCLAQGWMSLFPPWVYLFCDRAKLHGTIVSDAQQGNGKVQLVLGLSQFALHWAGIWIGI